MTDKCTRALTIHISLSLSVSLWRCNATSFSVGTTRIDRTRADVVYHHFDKTASGGTSAVPTDRLRFRFAEAAIFTLTFLSRPYADRDSLFDTGVGFSSSAGFRVASNPRASGARARKKYIRSHVTIGIMHTRSNGKNNYSTSLFL